jgi:DNA end-binding protein Ku
MASAQAPKTPAPRRGTNLTIGFGLVNVQVKYAPLVPSGTGRASARTCCATHRAPVTTAYRCSEGGELVESDGKVMLYEVDGRYVEVDTDALALGRTGRLEVEAAVEAGSLDPLYFEKAYLVWPSAGHEQPFDLLVSLLRQSGKLLVGTTEMANATKVVALRYSELAGTLVAHGCVYDERLAWDDVALVRQAANDRPALPEAMVAQGAMLVDSLDGEFDTAAVTDEYAAALSDAIARAAAGLPPAEKADEPAPEPAVDLMAALAASVEAAGKPATKSRKKVAA